MTLTLRPLQAAEAPQCEALLRSLPDWFGIEKSIVEYVAALQRMEAVVAARDGAVVGFLTLNQHFDRAAEIHVMAVAPAHHGQGVGRALVEHAEQRSRERAISFLQVKTLGPSRPDPNYARTRGFYLRMGFAPLEETDLWGDTNPCLILVKHLACSSP